MSTQKHRHDYIMQLIEDNHVSEFKKLTISDETALVCKEDVSIINGEIQEEKKWNALIAKVKK